MSDYCKCCSSNRSYFGAHVDPLAMAESTDSDELLRQLYMATVTDGDSDYEPMTFEEFCSGYRDYAAAEGR